ncbi:DUF4249 domain-containing protein [Spirosoma sp. KUDC1026]|uniref:DUF4249 domain-containing protein n=1 Tax=Spirosoma sp. KUDC1026 TaxID=2745947 RepID=UPI00159BE9D8|nr:DUF4249 domain-containing protein [Spirosoma sp. KUDC1026]QKZ11566.1 DUF4249 domain-containing protein [Spirosoma sp. KUDC1026]
MLRLIQTFRSITSPPVLRLLGWSLVLLVAGCVDPYRPPEITAPGSYLVVNGFFDSAPGSTTSIRLTRTQNLADSKAPTVETKAQVTIESMYHGNYPLQETRNGTYSLTGVTPLINETYRLRIKTAQGKEYVSEYVPVVTTPAIDSVNWFVENDGVQINVNTHDPRGNTRYYRWDYNETWEFTAAYQSSLELINNQLVGRTEDAYRCWTGDSSSTILLSTSARLSQDIISQRPLMFIPGQSIKLGIRYSMLVRQYGLTKEAYDYYEQLAKITQSVGSLFDPQPSQITGNIHSVSNSADLVLGFFRVGSVTSKRIFIQKAQLPPWYPQTGNTLCQTDTMTLDEIRQNQPGGVVGYFDQSQYLTSSLYCVDCRLRGTNKRPAFWSN